MAAIAPLPSPVPGLRVRVPRAPRWLGSAAYGALALAALGSLVPPAVGAVAAGQVLPAEAARPSVALEGTISTDGLPVRPAVSTLVVRNTGPVPISWRVRADVSGPGAAGVVVEPRPAGGATCSADATWHAVPALDDRSWSDPLAPGGTVTLCVTVRTVDRGAGTATPTVHVDAHAA